MLAGLACALRDLRAAGCKRAYIDGSFITTKEHPGDFDACWDLDGVDFDVIDEVLLTFDAGRRAQKAKYRGELFPADAAADPLGTLFRDFFQRDRDGNPKGIIVIDLEDFERSPEALSQLKDLAAEVADYERLRDGQLTAIIAESITDLAPTRRVLVVRRRTLSDAAEQSHLPPASGNAWRRIGVS